MILVEHSKEDLVPLLKDKWNDWAAEWGLTHVPEKGVLRRTEGVIGPHGGLLVRIGWGVGRDSLLVTMIRFPKTASSEALRQALIADPTLDALPGKGAARRKMKVAPDAKQADALGAIPEFVLTENTLLWRRRIAFAEPKPAEIQSWVDTLCSAIARATPVFEGRCETCGTGSLQQYVLVDGIPMWLCSSCQERLRADGEQADRAYEMSDARHVPGATLALGAAVVGAVGWALVSAPTQRIFSAAAIGIGVLVAFAYRKGAGRVDNAGRLIAAGFTVLSVVLGEVLLFTLAVSASHPDVGFRLDAGWSVYVKAWQTAPGQEAISLLFGLIGAWAATRALVRPRLRHTIEQPAAPEGRQQKAA